MLIFLPWALGTSGPTKLVLFVYVFILNNRGKLSIIWCDKLINLSMLELSYNFQTMDFQPKNCWSTVQLLFNLFALWPFLDVIKYLGLQFKYYANFILIGDKIFFNIFSLLKSRLDERPEGWVDISNISGREWTLGCLLHWSQSLIITFSYSLT